MRAAPTQTSTGCFHSQHDALHGRETRLAPLDVLGALQQPRRPISQLHTMSSHSSAGTPLSHVAWPQWFSKTTKAESMISLLFFHPPCHQSQHGMDDAAKCGYLQMKVHLISHLTEQSFRSISYQSLFNSLIPLAERSSASTSGASYKNIRMTRIIQDRLTCCDEELPMAEEQ